MPPVLLGATAASEVEVGPVPVCRTAFVLDSIIERLDSGELRAELPGKAFDHRCAFHVPAEQSERVRDAVTDYRIDALEEVNRLDEAGDFEDCVTPWRGLD